MAQHGLMRRSRANNMARKGCSIVLLLLAGSAAASAQQWNPFGFLSLPKVSLALESTSDDANQDACTVSKGYTRPQLARVSVCAQSRAVSANGAGLVTAWSNSTLNLRSQASVACSESISNNVRGLCTGGDPMAAISSMASACASALVELQMESISGVNITPSTNIALVKPDKRSWTNGCSNGCANGQMAAEAVAQASTCAWTAATKGCNAVRVALSSQNYAQAFIKTTAAAWSNACAMGVGNALSQGTSLANSAVTVLSKAMGQVVANACSSCATCKCKPLPAGFSYDKMDQLSNASAIASNGTYTLGKAMSSAVASYCDSDRSTKQLQTDVSVVINTIATMLAKVMVATSSKNTASGVALACSSGNITQQIRMSKMAFINSLNDASALVFDQCASADLKMKQMVNSLQDSLDTVFNSVSSECAKSTGGSTPKVVNTANTVSKVLQANKPVVKAIAEALQDSVSCGCKPGNCFFCKPPVTANATNAVSSYDLGGNKKNNSKGIPLNWNDLSGSTSG